MKKITICSSIKFKDQIVQAYQLMEKAGIEPLFPELKSNFINNPTPNQKLQLAQNHFDKIKESNAVYFITQNGYMGTSCKLELGYSIALGKPIYFSELTNDDALDSWAKQIIPIEKIPEAQF